ncbi:MAG: hypothetical protein FWG14_13605 [Peptococcaceae bacterium]|nr:hypothetical protein [Peptococcaceae bacterium]
MMISIHAAAGIVSSVFFIKENNSPPGKKGIAVAAASNIALHGAMDFLPHSHPISPYLDGIIVLLMTSLFFFVKREYKVLVFSCYLGGIIPDVIDLGVFRVLRFGSFKIFPWHYTSVFNFLNELYPHALVNISFNVLSVAACAGIVFFNRKRVRTIFSITTIGRKT